MNWLGLRRWGRRNGPGDKGPHIGPRTPALAAERSLPQCNQVRKMVFKIRRDGTFPSPPLLVKSRYNRGSEQAAKAGTAVILRDHSARGPGLAGTKEIAAVPFDFPASFSAERSPSAPPRAEASDTRASSSTETGTGPKQRDQRRSMSSAAAQRVLLGRFLPASICFAGRASAAPDCQAPAQKAPRQRREDRARPTGDHKARLKTGFEKAGNRLLRDRFCSAPRFDDILRPGAERRAVTQKIVRAFRRGSSGEPGTAKTPALISGEFAVIEEPDRRAASRRQPPGKGPRQSGCGGESHVPALPSRKAFR